MNDYKEIIKWVNYISFWCTRYYKIDGAMFCYSRDKNFQEKRTVFLGICTIRNKDDFLEMSTGSMIWYFKGKTKSETESFKSVILKGIEKGIEILKSNQQNLAYIPEISEIKKVKEEEEINLININNNEETLDTILDKKSTSTVIDTHNYKQVLKKIESKIKLPNNAFKNYLDSDEYDKEDLKELYNQYNDIEKKMKKINNFFNNLDSNIYK